MGSVAAFFDEKREGNTMREEETFANPKLERGREDGRAVSVYLLHMSSHLRQVDQASCL